MNIRTDEMIRSDPLSISNRYSVNSSLISDISITSRSKQIKPIGVTKIIQKKVLVRKT